MTDETPPNHEGTKHQPPVHLRNDFLPPTHPSTTHTPPALQPLILCGPLLRYTGTDYATSQWRGSVLIVARDDAGAPDCSCDGVSTSPAEIIHQERGRTFWRVALNVPLRDAERAVTYQVRFQPGSLERRFWVPGKEDTMRIMFHSCNGFSVGSDEEAFSGPALWNNVLNVHAERPFHVMIGGGDQIYSDGIRVTGPLKDWAAIKNPVKRRRFPWGDELRDETDEWYCKNYMSWYSTAPFSYANSQIAQVNIWDDHDIIDGYGSYTDKTMLSPVFRGIGKVAYKYYILFQHHTPFEGEDTEDPSWIIGKQLGRYCEQSSRSIYSRLGKKVAFLGVDARTERTRHMVNYQETYDLMFERVQREIDASNGDIQHLIVLLGVPIAYPRLVWLEAIFSSPVFGFLSFLNKRFGFGDALFNKFDNEADLLDDLDDHYCSRNHKKERNDLLLRFQTLSASRNVRITFLSGDVHLAAIGRFYAAPKLAIQTEHDHRYMVNVISSAITNKPPPKAVSNLLARRNKIHHLDNSTDEQLLDFFDKDVDGEKRPGNHNTMPRRNYCIITEGNGFTANIVNGDDVPQHIKKRNAVGTWEIGAGSDHPAAAAGTREEETVGIKGGDGTLNVAIRVEVDKSDRSGETFAYGFAIPALMRGETLVKEN